jgi:murein DD-endopeptidase MepM/ murein hydrolase activator NlpD
MTRPRIRSLLLVGVALAGPLLVVADPAAAASSTVSGTVDSGGTPLNVRSAPSTRANVVGTVASGRQINLVCQVAGQNITGRVRTTTSWDRTVSGGYVSDAYVRRSVSLGNCSTPTPAASTPPSTPASIPPTARVAGTVDSGDTPLSVRTGPTTSAAVVRTLANGSHVDLTCQTAGQNITGRVRTTTSWDRTTDGQYISDAYIRRSASPGTCPAGSTPTTAGTPALPAQAAPGVKTSWVIPVPGKPGQAFRPASNPTHDGVDIMEPRNTPIKAANAGTVITVICNTSGPSCDVDGSASVRGCGWYVEIQHAGNIITRYCHMVRKPSVVEGQQVSAGQVIGYVGTSGNSSGTHLHYEVHIGPGYATSANAVNSIEFMKRENAPLGG